MEIKCFTAKDYSFGGKQVIKNLFSHLNKILPDALVPF
jgi:hypothetical protein